MQRNEPEPENGEDDSNLRWYFYDCVYDPKTDQYSESTVKVHNLKTKSSRVIATTPAFMQSLTQILVKQALVKSTSKFTARASLLHENGKVKCQLQVVVAFDS